MLIVSWVAKAGALELAFGALSGWVIALSVDRPQALAQIGVRAPGRLRQAHLDYIIMGVILVGLGLAAPRMPAPIAVLLVTGAAVNPSLFVPLAWQPALKDRAPYRMLTAASFSAMSAGTVGAAIHLL
ncbi:MAG: hypothetical protein NVSMB51_03880 [Solirubrobacteraceae bacterium]